MIRDITIGQYYDTNSPIHRLDPRTKIIGTFAYIVGLFLVKSIFGFVLAAALLFAVIRISKIPLSFILRGQKSIAMLLVLTIILNMFMIKGDPLVSFGFLTISRQGLYTAIFMAVRLVLLVIGCSLMTLTTTPLSLTDGLEHLMRPLKVLKVPVHDIAMMMSIALRFIPILLEETDKIMKAQSARGADFETGSLVQRTKALIPVLVPLFVSAFRRADELATAMEARCYRGDEGRTQMKQLHYTKMDILALMLIVLSVVALYLSRYLPSVSTVAGYLWQW